MIYKTNTKYLYNINILLYYYIGIVLYYITNLKWILCKIEIWCGVKWKLGMVVNFVDYDLGLIIMIFKGLFFYKFIKFKMDFE